MLSKNIILEIFLCILQENLSSPTFFKKQYNSQRELAMQKNKGIENYNFPNEASKLVNWRTFVPEPSCQQLMN